MYLINIIIGLITNSIYDIVKKGLASSNMKGFLDINRKEVELLNKDYYISLSFENGKTIDDILNLSKVIVVGNPGSGKTQLLVDIFFRLKERLKKIKIWKWEFYYKNEFLPLFIPLRDLGSRSLDEYINLKIIQYNLKGNQKFILLLDGLDEIPLEIAKNILDFIENNQQHKYIITSRKGSLNLGKFLYKHPDFEKFEIKEFNFDIEKGGNTEILEKYFKSRGKEIDLKKYKKLQIEIKDVFYLEQFFEVYEELSEKDGKLELTEKYIQKLSNKNGELLEFQLESDELFKLLEEVASFLYKNNSLRIKRKDLEKLIESFINETKQKDFLNYLIKTFFIGSEGEGEYYSFRHKTFYDYFLVRYIGKEYDNNKLSIRNGNILLDKEFIKTLFYPYLHRKYKKSNNYEKIIGLNLFIYYYDNYPPLIDDINIEDLLRALFDLPEDILRYYIFDNFSPIYDWFNNYEKVRFKYLNFTTIKIALDKGYKDIATDLYKKLNKWIDEAKYKKDKILSELSLLDKDSDDYNIKKRKLEDELESLFYGLDYHYQAYVRVFFKKFSSFYELYKLIRNKGEINILDKIGLINDFYFNPYYAFFDDLLKYGNQNEILKILEELTKKEFYIFLQVGLKLDNINQILGNKEILEIVKNKFNSYKGDFKEFMYDDQDNAITLFFKYILGFFKDEKEIFNSKEYYKLKEGRNGFFDYHWGFSKFNLNDHQLASYIFYKETNLKGRVEKYYYSKEEGSKEYRLLFFREVYQYSYSLFINSLLSGSKINFKEYINIISEYLSFRNMKDGLRLKEVFSELLAYIFYYSVNKDYLANIKLIWDYLGEFVDKLPFYRTINKIDIVRGTNKLKEIIENEEEIREIENEINGKNDRYFSDKIEKNIFISRLYGYVGANNSRSKNLQIKLFSNALSYGYIRYGFRKEYYLSLIFDVIKELKINGIITEVQTFRYIDQIIDLYSVIYGITEKGDNRYLDKDIIKFVSQISIKKAEEYVKKLYSISNYGYKDEIEAIILIQKIKDGNYKIEDIKNLHFYNDKDGLLELKVYLYLIDKGEDKYIDVANSIIEYLNGKENLRVGYNEEELELYEKLYKQGKIKKCDLILNELKNIEDGKGGYKKEIISLEGLTDKEIINLLDNKKCNWMYHTSWSGDYNYLLSKLYEKNKELFYNYISDKSFTNFKGLAKVYIEHKENNKAINLLEELIDFGKLLVK